QNKGKIFTELDVDKIREYNLKKDKRKKNKLISLSEAIDKYVENGDYLASTGFGLTRIPSAALYEIVRQKKKNLGFSLHMSSLSGSILTMGKCFNRCDFSYGAAFEAMGINKAMRRYLESGNVEYTDWSNSAISWRLRAAAMGIPFIPIRSMLGTDTEKYSAGIEIECPFTKKKLLAVPALYPDVAIIHVHAADVYGNAEIKGILVSDIDISRATKKLIITTEELVSDEYFRSDPSRTVIPYYLVDAVVHVPFGGYPSGVPYRYYMDIDHLNEILEVEADEKEYEAFIEKNIYQTKDFYDYLNIQGGFKKMQKLIEKEQLLGVEGGENE
ncbi:MAG: CoA-transferase, partial [Deferribacterota bacterium]|nr:CoA-transferase [Deferribacterota bacterium]